MTPELTVSGVESGDTVKVYSDTACTTEVGSGIFLETFQNGLLIQIQVVLIMVRQLILMLLRRHLILLQGSLLDSVVC
jgi:hypothetical protein